MLLNHHTEQLLEYIEDSYHELKYSVKKVNQLFLKADYSILQKYQANPLFFYFSLDFAEKGIHLYPSTVDFILKHTSLKNVDTFGLNPLMYYLMEYSSFVKKISLEQFQYLIEHSDLNHVDNEGKSALYYAVTSQLPIDDCKKMIDLNVKIFHPKDKIIKAILLAPEYLEIFSYLLTTKNLKIHSELKDWMQNHHLTKALSLLNIVELKNKMNSQIKNENHHSSSIQKL